MRDDDGTGLGLPVGVDDRALLLADVLPVPLPGFRVDRLTDGADRAEGRKVVALGVLFAEAAEQTDRSRGSVKLRELVLGDDLPEARRGRVDRGRFEDGGRYAVCT